MYECDICDKSFANKSNLNRHYFSRHQMEEDYQSSHYSEEEIDETYDTDEDEDSQEDLGINIWHHLHNESERRQARLIFLYKELVLLSKVLKRDEIHQAVMRTVKKAQEEEEMDFREALDFAIDKRKFLLHRKMNEMIQLENDSSEDEDQEEK